MNRSIAASGWPADDLEPELTPPIAPSLLPLAEEVAAACQRCQRFEEQLDQASGNASAVAAVPPPDELFLVQKLQAALAEQPEQLAAFEAHCDWTLFDWVSDRIFAAAEHGQLDTALRLFDDWDKLTADQTADLIGTRERLLLCGGRIEEAKAVVQARLAAEPDDLDALESATFIYQKSGALETAEQHARRYLTVAQSSGDATDEICALQTLAEVLHERGAHDEARALEHQAAELPLSDFEEESRAP